MDWRVDLAVLRPDREQRPASPHALQGPGRSPVTVGAVGPEVMCGVQIFDRGQLGGSPVLRVDLLAQFDLPRAAEGERRKKWHSGFRQEVAVAEGNGAAVLGVRAS